MEFSGYNLAELTGDLVVVPTRPKTYRVRVLPNVDVFYDARRKGVFKDMAYLNMCAMRVFLSKAALLSENPYVRALSLEDDESIQRWNIVEVFYAVSLYRLIKKASLLEQDHLTMGYAKLRGSERDSFLYENPNAYHVELLDSIVVQAEHIALQSGFRRKISAIRRSYDIRKKVGCDIAVSLMLTGPTKPRAELAEVSGEPISNEIRSARPRRHC